MKNLLLVLLTTLFFTNCTKQDAVLSKTVNNPDSIIIAGGLIRGTFTNVVGAKAVWKFLTPSDNHDKIWFDSVNALPNGLIRVYYPNVSRVVSFLAQGDEILGKYAKFGYSIGTSYTDIHVSEDVVNGGELKGNNTSAWTKSAGVFQYWDVARDTTGLTRVNIGYSIGKIPTVFDYQKLVISYSGSNIRFIKRIYNNIPGNYNAAFYLTDIMGNIVKGNSDPNDRVILTSGIAVQNVNCYQTGGDLMQLSFFPPSSNISLIAQFKK